MKLGLDKYIEMERENSKVFSIMLDYIFPFLLKNRIKPIIISGSPQEAIDTYKEEFMFYAAYGIRFEIVDNKYTNNCILHTETDHDKKRIVDQILLENLDSEVLFAFGDSESDTPLLKSANQAFINSSKKFLIGKQVHYFDFSSIQSGEQIVELMSQTLEFYNKEL